MFLKLNLQCMIDSLFNTKCITKFFKKLQYKLYELAWSCDYDPESVKPELRSCTNQGPSELFDIAIYF